MHITSHRMSDNPVMEAVAVGLPSSFSTEAIADENREMKRQGIQELRERIACDRPDIAMCLEEDVSLVRFLRARNNDVGRAFELLCQYQEFKRKNQSLLQNATASDLHYVLEDGLPCVLPDTDSSGRTIIVLFAGAWDSDTYGMEQILKALLITMERLSENEDVQINGIVLLADFTGWGSKHSSQVTLSSLRKAFGIFQDGVPIRLKGVHFINEPWYVSTVVTLLRPFLKDNMKDRVFLHGNNMATLHKHLDPATLPAEFGGSKPEVDQGYWAKRLVASEIANHKTKPVGENPLKPRQNECAQVQDSETEVLPNCTSTW